MNIHTIRVPALILCVIIGITLFAQNTKSFESRRDTDLVSKKRPANLTNAEWKQIQTGFDTMCRPYLPENIAQEDYSPIVKIVVSALLFGNHPERYIEIDENLPPFKVEDVTNQKVDEFRKEFEFLWDYVQKHPLTDEEIESLLKFTRDVQEDPELFLGMIKYIRKRHFVPETYLKLTIIIDEAKDFEAKELALEWWSRVPAIYTAPRFMNGTDFSESAALVSDMLASYSRKKRIRYPHSVVDAYCSGASISSYTVVRAIKNANSIDAAKAHKTISLISKHIVNNETPDSELINAIETARAKNMSRLREARERNLAEKSKEDEN